MKTVLLASLVVQRSRGAFLGNKNAASTNLLECRQDIASQMSAPADSA